MRKTETILQETKPTITFLLLNLKMNLTALCVNIGWDTLHSEISVELTAIERPCYYSVQVPPQADDQ